MNGIYHQFLFGFNDLFPKFGFIGNNSANNCLRSNDTIRGIRTGVGATNHEEKNYE